MISNSVSNYDGIRHWGDSVEYKQLKEIVVNGQVNVGEIPFPFENFLERVDQLLKWAKLNQDDNEIDAINDGYKLYQILNNFCEKMTG